MSRLIVKNLPKNITSEKLRETFSTTGTVTDVQLKFTKDGKFRHFGFVGYKTEEECKAALDYYNNTYLTGAKITVEICSDLGDPSKPKAWSKYSSDSSTAAKAAESTQDKGESKGKKTKKIDENALTKILEKHKGDALFDEFIETHTKKNKAIWSNDAVIAEENLPNIRSNSTKKEKPESHSEEESEEDSGGVESDEDEVDEKEEESDEDAEEKALANEDISDMEYLKRLKGKNNEEKEDEKTPKKTVVEKKKKDPIPLFTVKIRGLGFKARKSHVRHFFHSLKPYSIRLPPRIKGIAYVGFKTEREMKQALTRNKGFLSGRQIMVNRYEEKDATSKEEDGSTKLWKWKDQEESLRNEESIGESGRIFMRNLAHTVTEEDIETLFSKYGPIAEINIPVDWITRKPKGFGTVMFVIPEHAVAAFSELDGKSFQGKMLHLLPGKAKPEDNEEMDGLSYKQKKAKKLKEQAKSSHNWNTLFLGQNAVVDAIAKEYDTTKEKVLDSSHGRSVAVRLALGETQLVNKTRDFLVQNGVSLNAFDQAPTKRSKTVLLVKNLPSGTDQSEIRSLFEKHALLGRVILPPSGLTAIVEFSDPTEARSAFRKLAYSKYKDLPLYLEWAPENTFYNLTANDEKDQMDKNDVEKNKNSDNKTSEVEVQDEIQNEDEEEDIPEPDTILFVKNLNFNTNETALAEHFKKCGKIHNATIAKKKDVKNPQEMLSMGYGFVQFKKKSCAEKALKTLQHSMLDGHAVELKRSNRTVDSEVQTARKKSTPGKQTGSKILVRNIPFEATQKELTELFQTFGDLKFVRLPKKMVGTGSHRGFGFVEYLTKSDAKQAFKAMSQSTHLYGRRLVLEWASNEEDVNELRKRTAQHFSESAPKRSAKSILNADSLDDE